MTAKIKAFGEVMMRLEVPNYQKLEQTNELQVSYAGTGVNILGGLQRFGHETSLVSKLPLTSVGDAAMARIRSHGIQTDDIVRGGDFMGMYFLENGFDVRSSKVTYSDRLTSSFNTASIHDFDVEGMLADTALIHFCGIALAMTEKTRENTLKIARKAKEKGITVVFDHNYRPKLWKDDYVLAKQYYEEMLELADICFMSDKDATLLLGFTSEKTVYTERLEDLLSQVAEKYKIGTIACTIRGKLEESNRDVSTLQGFLLRHDKIAYSPIYSYRTLDRIGAGDGFASGIIHSYIEEFSMEDTIRFSTAAGVLAHTTYGDTPICSEEEIWNYSRRKDQIDLER